MISTLLREKADGRFIGGTRAKAVQVACDALQACLQAYQTGDRQGAIRLLNSDKLRPIAVVQAVQGRVLEPGEASQYTSYPCVSPHLVVAMRAGKSFEELKRAARTQLHEVADVTAKFEAFIHLLDTARQRTA